MRWKGSRPDHKAVEVRLRYSEEKRGKAEWKCAAKYPQRVRDEVRQQILSTLEDASIRSERRRMGTWQRKVRNTLQKYEKEARKESQRSRQKLREKRYMWKAQAMDATTPSRRKEANGKARRFQT